MLGIALLMASCTEDFKNWADPQSNSETSKAVGFSIANAADIDYAELSSDSVQLFVPTITAQDDAVNTFVATLYNADKTASQAINADAKGMVSAADLKAAVIALFGKKPETRSIEMDVTGYTLIEGQSVKNNGTAQANITLTAPFIAEGYYLTGDMFKEEGQGGGWDVNHSFAFNHDGEDVYANPVFTITFENPYENSYWKIIPKNNYDDPDGFWNEGETGVLGVAIDGDESLSGSLTTDSPQAGKIVEPGYYKMTINMEDYTYEIVKVDFAEFIYEIGNESGWGTSHALRSPNMDGKYRGFYWLDGEYKFKPDAMSWNGDWEYDGELNGNAPYEGKFADNGGGNFPAVPAGFYRIDASLDDMTYKLTPILTVGLIGTAQPGGWDEDTDLEWNATKQCWEGKNIVLTEGEFKFRGNDNWGDLNLGGSLDNLVTGGGNIQAVAGTYDVELYVSYEGNCYCVMTKK